MQGFGLTKLVALVAALLGAAGAWQIQDWRYNARIQSMQAEFTKTVAAAERDAQEQERRLNSQIQEARDAAAKREQDLRRDSDTLRSELDGLRNEAADAGRKLPRNPACPSSARAATAIKLFEQCAVEYEKMARHAQGHANDALMLQEAWPK
jgi:predicted  nucleic acid-binding Zn-ribbon protein